MLPHQKEWMNNKYFWLFAVWSLYETKYYRLPTTLSAWGEKRTTNIRHLGNIHDNLYNHEAPTRLQRRARWKKNDEKSVR